VFGKNIITRPSKADGTCLNVVEIFKTLQGEGPFTGRPAIFVRLGGCNLRCTFCDTEFDKFERMDVVQEIVPEILRLSQNNVSLVVITGGEPLLQDISLLTNSLAPRRFVCQIETAGVAPLKDGRNVSVVCSPKTIFVHPTVQEVCRDWKYPVRVGSLDTGSPVVRTHENPTPLWFGDDGRKPPGTVWLQPITEYSEGAVDKMATLANQHYAAEMCIKHGYSLSLQTHKIVNIR
jgi:organic radical activating enzyme